MVLSFDEAVADSADCRTRHLLLGNGFSIACEPGIFQYASLFDAADFSSAQELRTVFELLNTTDFEVAIRTLENAARIVRAYAEDGPAVAAQMTNHASQLKQILLETIARNHPESPNSIQQEKFWACRKFVNHFLGPENTGYVFSLNYDLLLYWALMHDDIPFGEELALKTDDGFRADEDALDADYVVWQGETEAHSARVYYLHGALHLFDAGNELQKFTWSRTGDRLIDQARLAMNAGKFPLFVAEGTAEQKKNRIRHNAYLYQGFKTLVANVKTGTHCFFLHGHSLAANDDHILKRLSKGKFKKLYVSLYGDPGAAENRGIIARANKLAGLRPPRFPLEVKFYDAESAQVWG